MGGFTRCLPVALVVLGVLGQEVVAAPAAKAVAGIQVWTSDVVSSAVAPTAVKELKPVRLEAAKNGTFSGKIVVESAGEIKGIKASAGALTGKGGVIPASDIQIRYGGDWDANGRYPFRPNGPDILLDSSPDATPVRGHAVVTVWVTVHVPKDAVAGEYDGEVTVEPPGVAPVKVSVNLDVADWALPDPQDYRTWTDFVESPDTLALEYNVPMWSDKHWALIDNSFRLMSPTGCRIVYVPLITGTNFGNSQSMVRWIKKADGTYDYDYSVMDKYLDSAEKNLGKPKLVAFLVWDIYMSQNSLKRGLWGGDNDTRKARTALLGEGPRVTVLDPKTKETSTVYLPSYEDPASKALWQPMFEGILKRMRARGLEKTMMLGMMPDLWPTKKEVAFWNEIGGNLPWVIHAHGGPIDDVIIGKKALYKIADIGYAACVNSATYSVNPDLKRLYGWKNPALVSIYERFELNNDAPSFLREFQAFNLTGDLHGAGRMGADFWPAIRDKKGNRAGMVYAHYPEDNWRNLDIGDYFLAPGPDGAVATARLEYLREGTEVCESRIYLESMLLDAEQKAKVGPALAQECQDALDAHQRAMWHTVWANDDDLKSVAVTTSGRSPVESLYASLKREGKPMPTDYWHGEGAALRVSEAKKGQAEFVNGWQDREKKLFDLSGEVAVKLGSK